MGLIKDAGSAAPFDLMGFQECDDVHRVLGDAGLTDTFGTVSPGHAVAIAYRNTVWELLDSGMDTVGEDMPGLYGARVAVWARLRHQTTGITVFFINHHGPLPVNSGGVGGGNQTAQNILNAIPHWGLQRRRAFSHTQGVVRAHESRLRWDVLRRCGQFPKQLRKLR